MVRRAGVSPVVGGILMILIAIGLAGGAAVFVQTMQSDVNEQLSSRGEALDVERIRCDGSDVKMFVVNEAEEPLQLGLANLYVTQGGEPLASKSVEGIALSGGFRNPQGQGWINESVSLSSGQSYTISVEFEASTESLTVRCNVPSGGP